MGPEAGITGAAQATAVDRPRRYVGFLLTLTLAGMATLFGLNKLFAPEMYLTRGTVPIANALSIGNNYAVFDLNINIRELRDAHIARLPRAPDVVMLGASHWQEAHVSLIPGAFFYNAHIHRDYYEDMLAMVEILVRHDKLPAHLVVSIRDNLFTPIAERRDNLWLPGIPYYRAMAKRLGLPHHSEWATLPVPRWREQASVQMLLGNMHRWFVSDVRPHETGEREFDALDTLLPGGSILWSRQHRALFTHERAEKSSLDFAAQNRNAPPRIDPAGVEAIDRLLEFLASKGTRVVLAHPPFNPTYFTQMQDTPYMKGLHRVEELTRRMATQHGLPVIGSFDPHKVGCSADMFIDAEHANATCLGRVLDQLPPTSRETSPALVAGLPLRPQAALGAIKLGGLSDIVQPAHPVQAAMIAVSQTAGLEELTPAFPVDSLDAPDPRRADAKRPVAGKNVRSRRVAKHRSNAPLRTAAPVSPDPFLFWLTQTSGHGLVWPGDPVPSRNRLLRRPAAQLASR